MDVDGMHMLINDTPLNRNTLQIEIANPGQQTFSVTGEGRWFERMSDEGKYNYNVGIKFLRISEKDVKTIVEFIKDKPEDLSVVSRSGGIMYPVSTRARGDRIFSKPLPKSKKSTQSLDTVKPMSYKTRKARVANW